MNKPQRAATIGLWFLAVVAMVGVLALRTIPADKPAERPVISAAAFSLTDQDNNTVTNDQLKGHPWIGDFVFTSCASICPLMSARMSALQSQVFSDVKLVSFSVDPQHDTPPVMKKYLAGYNARPGRWVMLTGDPKTEAAVVEAMKLHFAPATATDAIQHDSHFVLVDAEGHILDYYDSNDLQAMARLVKDANALSNHPTTEPQ